MTILSPAFEQRINRAWTILRQHPTLLTDQPHPNPDLQRQGRSFRSYVTFLLRSAGNAGKTRACRYVEEAQRHRDEPKLRLPQPTKGDHAP